MRPIYNGTFRTTINRRVGVLAPTRSLIYHERITTMLRIRIFVRRRNNTRLSIFRRRNNIYTILQGTSGATTTGIRTSPLTTIHAMRRNTILVRDRCNIIIRPTRPLKRTIPTTRLRQITLHGTRRGRIYLWLSNTKNSHHRHRATTINNGDRPRQNTLHTNRVPIRLFTRNKNVRNRPNNTINEIHYRYRHSNIQRNARVSTIFRHFTMGILNTTFRPRLITKTIMRRGTNLTHDRHQTNMATLSTNGTNTTGTMRRTNVLIRNYGTTKRKLRYHWVTGTNLLQPTRHQKRNSIRHVRRVLCPNSKYARHTNNGRDSRCRHHRGGNNTTWATTTRPLTHYFRVFRAPNEGQLSIQTTTTTVGLFRNYSSFSKWSARFGGGPFTNEMKPTQLQSQLTEVTKVSTTHDHPTPASRGMPTEVHAVLCE